MSQTYPLMPKATAVWLIDNTSLTFEQIAKFCGLHPLEVRGIADGEVAEGVRGLDPVSQGQVERGELEKAEADSDYIPKLTPPPVESKSRKQGGPRYTPVSRRQDRPDAIAWILRYHPEITEARIAKLLGTTKPTIQSVRNRTHWNASNITPTDPVTLGLCSQTELDAEVERAREKKEAAAQAAPVVDEGPRLEPVSDEAAFPDDRGETSTHREDDEALDPESVFKS